MKHAYISVAVFIAAFAPGMEAQIGDTDCPVPPELSGRPPEPPFLTLLSMLSPGKLATDPCTPPKGAAVQEVLYEELRAMATPAGPAGEVEASVRLKFDEHGNITEKIENRLNMETDTVFSYDDGRLVGAEATSPNKKQGSPASWSSWQYDSLGRLKEYRRGSGDEIQNHGLGFHYDEKGRLLNFKYRQGPDDKPFSRTEWSYSNDGKKIVMTENFAGTRIVDRSICALDDQGRVVSVTRESEGRTPNEDAKKITFRYDGQGRLIEQTTDAVKFNEVGAEDDLPPGTISISYDDKSHTKTTKYSVPHEGSMECVVMQNDDGATVGYSLKGASRQVSMKLECQYDARGNWKTCRQVGEANGKKSVAKEFRRSITYR